MNIFNPQQQSEVSIQALSEIEGSLEKKELRPRNNLIPGVFQEYKRTYVKVPSELKDQLSYMVFKEGFKIKDAAKQLCIKYATAKTIIFHLRRSSQNKAIQKRKICRYTQFSQKQSSQLKIVSKTSNEIVSSQDYILQYFQSE